MRIAIISDTHDNLATIKKIIDWLKKENIKLILHCGDVTTQETMDEIKKSFKGKVIFVKGNMEIGLEDLPEIEKIVLDNKRIAFCHKPELARELAKTGEYDIVFYGHTHKPWEEKIETSAGGSCRLINPGEAAGQINKPTFAVYDTATDNLELKIVERL